MKHVDVVIVGGGPAGMAAGIWCKRLGLEAVLLEERKALGGQLRFILNPIIDYPGLKTENGLELQEKFALHVQEAGIETVLRAKVQTIDTVERKVTYCLSGKEQAEEAILSASAIILAMGACDRRLWVPGEEELLKRGEVYSATRDSERFAGQKVAVVGGGDRSFEGALALAKCGACVTLIHRSDEYRARREFIDPVLIHPNIRVIPFAQIASISGETRLQSITVSHKSGELERLEIDALFVRIGVEPNSRLIRGSIETDERGFIVTDQACRTSAEGIYAVGDLCTQPNYSSLSVAAGQGMIAAKTIYQQLQEK